MNLIVLNAVKAVAGKALGLLVDRVGNHWQVGHLKPEDMDKILEDFGHDLAERLLEKFKADHAAELDALREKIASLESHGMGVAGTALDQLARARAALEVADKLVEQYRERGTLTEAVLERWSRVRG